MSLSSAIKRELRSVQAHFPGIRPLKFGLYNLGTRYLGRPLDADWLAIAALRPVGLAIDIGGNWGQSVAALKRTVAPEKIVTFEPNPALAKRLKQRFASDPQVTVEDVGLSDEPGEFDLVVPRYGDFVYDGLASIDEQEAAQWLNPERVARFKPERLSLDRYSVGVRTLDEFGFAPGIVKIDVQGLELQVVRGGRETFATHRPATIVEAPGAELIALFGEWDMAAWHYLDNRLVPHDGSYKNTLFLTDEQAERIRRKG